MAKSRVKLDKLDWTKDLINCLIESYETNPCLYDSNNKFNTNKHARNDALLNITADLKTIDERVELDEVKKKLISLRQHFSHENTKVQESLKSGAGVDEIYEPSVWWFEKLLFLSPHIKIRKSKSSLDTLIQASEPLSAEDGENRSSEASCSRLGKRKLQERDDPIITKTVATLEQLEKTFNNASANEKTDAQVFGDYVAREISKIKHEGMVTDLMHNINNCIYDVKTKWLKLQEQQQSEL